MFRTKKINYSFIISVLVTLVFFAIYSKLQFTQDTYKVFSTNIDTVTKEFFSIGRFVTGIFMYGLIAILKLNVNYVYIISYSLALFAVAYSVYRLYKLIILECSNRLISWLTSVLIIINIFSIEQFIYIEKGIMCLSILVCVFALEQFVELLKGKKHKIWIVFILMFTAICCYQGTVGIFVAVGLIFILKYSNTIKQFVINNLFLGLVYIIPAIANYLLIQIFSSAARLQGEFILIESVSKVIMEMLQMLVKTYEIIPPYIFAGLLLVIFGYAIYKFEKNKKMILGLIYVCTVTLLITILPQFMQNTESIWFTARSTYPAGALIGLSLLYILMFSEISRIETKVIAFAISIFLIIQLINFVQIGVDNHIVNYNDKLQAQEINNLIIDYEQETGVEITKIAIYEDQALNWSYPDVRVYKDVNLKAFTLDWITVAVLNYYGNNLEQITKRTELEEKFETYDWRKFDKEQILFIDNEMHICNY